MQHYHAMKALIRTLQDNHNSNKIFEGTTVFGGDYQVILLIVIHG